MLILQINYMFNDKLFRHAVTDSIIFHTFLLDKVFSGALFVTKLTNI